jgi:predicted thioesterase
MTEAGGKMEDLLEGAFADVGMTVEPASTAARFAREQGEAYPEVLATPVMIGEMERAAAAVLKPILAPDELSVGVRVEVAHLAPTPVGGRVVSSARFTGREGPLFWFDVTAADDGGVIGTGRHARAIVKKDAIMARAARRSTRT